MDPYNIPMYNVLHGGGVAIYVHKNINCTQVLSKSLSIDNILECITVQLMTVNQKKTCL